jgi:hypothetical protein
MTLQEVVRISGGSLIGSKVRFCGQGKVADKFPWKKINVSDFEYKKVRSKKTDITANKCRIIAIPV